MEEKDLYNVKNKWLKLWPRIKEWQKKGFEDWERDRAWETPLGRRYVGKKFTDQLNIMIQGCGADVAKYAFHMICKRLKSFNDVWINNFIHDSFIITSPNNPDIYKEVSRIVAESMQSSWVEISKYFVIKDLPMPVDVKVGLNWGDIEAGKNIIYSYHLD
jgi:DNA polymerase I-like protein with 3'-5' exonuclease and polymerase domains